MWNRYHRIVNLEIAFNANAEFSIYLNDFQCLHMTEDASYKSGCLRGAIVLFKSYVQIVSISTLVIFPLLVNQSSLPSYLHVYLIRKELRELFAFQLISVFLAYSLRKGLKMNRSTRDEAISWKHRVGERDLEVNDKSGETFSRFLLSYIDHIFSENT